ALHRRRQDRGPADLGALKHLPRLHVPGPCEVFQLDEIFMVGADVVDPALHRPVSVEVLDDLRGIEPRAVHPELADVEALEDGDEPDRVVVVGVRHHHVVDRHVAAVMLLDVLDDLIADRGVTAINDRQVIALFRAVLDKDGVPVAVADRQKLYWNTHSTTPSLKCVYYMMWIPASPLLDMGSNRLRATPDLPLVNLHPVSTGLPFYSLFVLNAG